MSFPIQGNVPQFHFDHLDQIFSWETLPWAFPRISGTHKLPHHVMMASEMVWASGEDAFWSFPLGLCILTGRGTSRNTQEELESVAGKGERLEFPALPVATAT